MENNMSNDLKFYINGEWINSDSNELIDVINPANEEIIGQITAGTIEDINSAVDAASEAFRSFSKSSKKKGLIF
jgi:aldehyde dehydrogenase (NAD+)